MAGIDSRHPVEGPVIDVKAKRVEAAGRESAYSSVVAGRSRPVDIIRA
jgi:hypothetical protein